MIQIILDGQTLPKLHIPFLEVPIENAQDVLTLDGTMYTRFVNQRREWRIHYELLFEDDYDVIRAIYDGQFTNEAYPNLTIAQYGVDDVPVRMRINERDIRRDGCYMVDVDITLTEQYAVGAVPSS